MKTDRSLVYGLAMASLAAGPVFMGSMALAYFYLQLPTPWTVELELAVSFVYLTLVICFFGFFVAFAFTALGSAIMIQVSEYFEIADTPEIWAFVGAAMMLAYPAIVGFDGFSPNLLFAMAVTGGSCAAICQRYADA